MVEADLITIAPIANDAAHMIAQAGPPTGLPSQVPDFLTGLLDTIGNAAGEGGLGERISELTPGGSEMAEGAGRGAAGGLDNPAR